MGVSADSATDAWAVGYYCTGTCPEQLPLLLHWNGTAWSPVPGPTLTAGGFLASVAAVSPSDAWAAGTSGLGKTLILHWDGTTWSQVASPSPNPSDLNTLAGVSADSATDAWAVGNYCAKNCFTSSEVFNSLILHWNGATWSKVPRPSLAPGDNGLESVSAVSPTAAFASGSFTGGTLILQWNGTSWSKAKAPNVFTALSGISASSATDAWAVGGASFLHWNGATWSTVAIPGPSTNFFGASTGSATNAWAVGGYCTTTSCTNYATAALHWNGNTWTRT